MSTSDEGRTETVRGTPHPNPHRIPTNLGYFMPAEWHPHQATWLAWPKNPVTWPQRIEAVQQTFLEMIALLAGREQVHLLVDDEPSLQTVSRELEGRRIPPRSVRMHQIPTADCWIRDYGPNFLIRPREKGNGSAFNHWQFNAWGNKYGDLKADGTIPSRLAPVLGMEEFRPAMVLEGGSIEVNGYGICLTTEGCLLNPNRNPGYSRSQIEENLKRYLGVVEVMWLGEGIVGDDTDAHVDQLARFVDPRTIVCALEEDPEDANYRPLQENYRRLKLARDRRGRAFRIVPIPMPSPLQSEQGRLPASYANFYIANDIVLVPSFGDANDRRVKEVLDPLFAPRRVVLIDCRELVRGCGAIHCVTQQQPRVDDS